ncbi:adenylate/guanylate cyclase domain-containing protein [Occultella kanbiaonis]|uniref:adenylate/guanylate cyclase domain-containing protein n=1 Tax=Occultella kanbiaonis TaxID=2675754 RepID=UPI0013D07825|nr:adenylate/guanylate cyclase domain-containing protein [Occultella kanbiaonis]
MTLKDEITQNASDAFRKTWTITEGRVVPRTDDIGLGNVGRKLDATVLYADLADSTDMVRLKTATFAAEVYKTYLYAASRLIAAWDGTVTAFDGDRVMGVFLGGSKNSNAVKCALKLNWVVKYILQPELKMIYSDTDFVIRQKVGIDKSNILVARTGIRGSNDLVWVGNAANNAAKMAALDLGYSTYISGAIFGQIADDAKHSKGKNMWTGLGTSDLGYAVYGSRYWWSL